VSTFGDLGTFGGTGSGLTTLYGDLDYGGASGNCVAILAPTDTTGSSVILELDGAELALDSVDLGWVVTKVDPGVPVTRTVVQDRPMSDGTFDSTRFVGGRTVLIDVSLLDGHGSNRQSMHDALAPYLNPASTLNLFIRFEIGGGYRRMRVRPSPQSFPWNRPGSIESTLAFRSVGSPYWTGPDIWQATAFPDEVKPGLAFDWEFDLSFPSAAGIGPASLYNRGTRPAEWVARIFGPITAPKLIHAATGRQVAFKSGFTIASGDYLTVDSTSRTALLNGDPGASRYGQLDFAATSDGWFQLAPGPNLVRLSGSAYLPPVQAEISFSHTYL
jgi:hypothetical protein